MVINMLRVAIVNHRVAKQAHTVVIIALPRPCGFNVKLKLSPHVPIQQYKTITNESPFIYRQPFSLRKAELSPLIMRCATAFRALADAGPATNVSNCVWKMNAERRENVPGDLLRHCESVTGRNGGEIMYPA